MSDSSTPLLALMDLGTNTFHLLIFDASGRDIHRRSHPVKMGEGGISRGQIAPAAQERILAAFALFSQDLAQYRVPATSVQAVATSAFRAADNATAVCEAIRQQSGIEIQIIDGQEEAALIAAGVQQAVPMDERPALICDIGGGSIEFILCDASQTYWQGSFEIGAQRMLDKFMPGTTLLPEALAQLWAWLDAQLPDLYQACAEQAPQRFIGAAGAFETLVLMHECRQRQAATFRFPENQTHFVVDAAGFEAVYEDLIFSEESVRQALPGLAGFRAQMMVPATALMQWVRLRFGLPVVEVSTYTLQQGLKQSLLRRGTYQRS
ncbi:hypothetical protein [Eisenibacter elegans]|jgi:exopolyphosphatase/guanosine-5'-triphosphate,3'-diphosphate pyrophosphatase|uniref:Ppx/GppA phosphatase family protein n=1 Tax=Eisenibacter elegans TaxID=997 RepID=UPI0003F80285|nr:hypothetical protein [Eisenibacter elegans]